MSSAHQMNGGGFWILCGCVVIVLLYCVNYGVFVDEENVMVATIELDSERGMSSFGAILVGGGRSETISRPNVLQCNNWAKTCINK
ncbi:unnamed protein product [Heligmosomoides polygyrus]|uniref:Transmembrane protein n=1 Tax=Heligmosomoides polygyrus TaxID=6339 RepID=A0A183GPB4_HELPZ|nr:unnamed protein product [Heligmosomoides polygyrus]